ncbi:MAG TPA: PEP-CTERM sorting domain-containing protein [Candidatus Acidoferrales bacterium]|nr:PEP-CTERM sorting domain-containing protein [Candidatus Acidoferrales bacterium]
MKKLLWISGVALFLFVMAGVPSARADSYQPSLSCNGNCVHAANVHHDFASHWRANIGHHHGDQGVGNANGSVAAVGAGDHDGDDGAMGGPPATDPGPGMGSSDPPPTAPTPEPSTVVLTMLGVGLLFLTRKRLIPRNT